MYKERAISWCFGIGACLLVIMAGKSCMGTPKPAKNNNTPTAATNASDANDYHVVTPNIPAKTEAASIGYDFFGKPIYATEPPSDIVAEDAVGDALGELIDTSENPDATDTSDMIDMTDTTEPTFPQDFDGNDHGNNQEEATTAADTTEAETKPVVTEITIPPGFDGNDHRVYDDSGNEIATIPPDYVIDFEKWR